MACFTSCLLSGKTVTHVGIVNLGNLLAVTCPIFCTGHAFSHDFHPQHVERLAAYWAEALGGPSMYSESYGDETAVVKISGNGVHDEMDRRAIACFDYALADVGLVDDSALRQVLHDYFLRRPRQPWPTTPGPLTTYLTDSPFRAGPGADSRSDRQMPLFVKV